MHPYIGLQYLVSSLENLSRDALTSLTLRSSIAPTNAPRPAHSPTTTLPVNRFARFFNFRWVFDRYDYFVFFHFVVGRKVKNGVLTRRFYKF